MGFEMIKPDGCLYILLKSQLVIIRIPLLSCRILRVKKQLLFIPGAAFGQYGEGYVRLSYAASMEVIKETMKRLEGV